MFKGMYPNCNFAIHHNSFDHIKLAEMLKKHKGGFLMTYNNCSTIRDLYGDCKFEYPEWQYTYGQGETRIGKNRQITTNDTREIWFMLKENRKGLCNKESCWLKQKFVDGKLNKELNNSTIWLRF